MKLNIREILSSGLEVELPVDLGSLNSRFEGELSVSKKRNSPKVLFFEAETKLKFSLSGQIIEMDGQSFGRFKTTCSRCLDEAICKVNCENKHLFKPVGERGSDEFNDETGISYYSDDEIEFREIIEESLVLNMPFSVFCRSDCKGLCLDCGENLNISICECSKKKGSDERMAVFRDLKIQ